MTYSYRIANGRSTPFSNLTFRDELPEDGRTFVAGTLNNSLGGTPNAFGGTRILEITGLTLPGRTLSSIDINTVVDDPNDTNDNAAGWSNLPERLLGIPQLGSEASLQSGDDIE